MNVVKREIKMNFKSLMFWALGAWTFLFMAGLEFSAYYGNNTIEELLSAMPPAILDSFEMGQLDLSTVTGYVGMMFSFLAVIVGFHAATVGAGLLSNEFTNKTSDFVLSLPISRKSWLANKIVGGVVICFLMLVLANVPLLQIVYSYDLEEGFFKFFMLNNIGAFIVQLVFFAIGVLASAMFKNPKKSGGFVLSLLGVMYFMQLVQPLHKNLEFLKYLTPFKFFVAEEIIVDGSLSVASIIISLVVVAVSIAGSFVYFDKRDITY